jgi:glycosyltransferase involved in cell wall biosynthesis
MAASLSPDLYHVHEPELLGPVIAHSADRPVVWDVHEPYEEKVLEKEWIPRVLRRIVRYAWDRRERHLLARCAAVVPATVWMCARYRDIHREVVPISNLPLVAETLDEIAPDRDRCRLVFTGTIGDVQGMRNVLKAMAILSSRGVCVFLEIAGVPASKRTLEELFSEADRLGIRGNLRHRGWIPRDDALQLQRECGIGIVIEVPNAGTAAGFPTKMLEYMLAGLPIVYSSLPTFQAVAADGQAGIAVDPHDPIQIADAIQRLVEDPGLAERLGRNGRRAVVERLNWSLDRVKLLELYSRILGPPIH